MADPPTVAVLLTSSFTALSDTLDRYHLVLNQLKLGGDDRDDFDRCCMCVLNLRTRYNTTLRTLLLGPATLDLDDDDDDFRRHPDRAVEVGRKYLDRLTSDSQRTFADTITEMEKAMSELYKQMRLVTLPTLRPPTQRNIRLHDRTDERLLSVSILLGSRVIPEVSGKQQVESFRNGKAQRDHLLSKVEKQIFSLKRILDPRFDYSLGNMEEVAMKDPVMQEELSESPYFDLVGDLFPRLRRPDRTWLRLRLSTANGVRKRFLQYCAKHPDFGNSSRQSTRSKSEGAIQHFPIGPSRARSRTYARTAFPSISQSSDSDLHQIPEHGSPNTRPPRTAVSRYFDVPLLDAINQGTRTFECPYCKSLLSCESQVAWRAHVLSDLRAYVCTSQNCDLRMFQTMEDWIEHELAEHQQTSTPQDGIVDAETGSTPGGATSIWYHWQAEQVDVKCLTADSCLLCDWSSTGELDRNQTASHAVSIDEYKRHVGEHLEQIALAVIVVGAEGFAPMPFKEQIDLRQLLSLQENLTSLQRYRIALAIASSFAVPVPSRWVISAWGSMDIFFFMVNGAPQYDAPRLRAELQSSDIKNAPLKRSGVMENSFVCLGILLLELCFGVTFEDRIVGQKRQHQQLANVDSRDPDPIELLAAAIVWADETESVAGYQYAKAIRYCLTQRVDRSGNQEWRHDLHSIVVMPIRANYETMASSRESQSAQGIPGTSGLERTLRHRKDGLLDD